MTKNRNSHIALKWTSLDLKLRVDGSGGKTKYFEFAQGDSSFKLVIYNLDPHEIGSVMI
jgi:hypothetical protein